MKENNIKPIFEDVHDSNKKDEIDLRELFDKHLSLWKWYLLTCIVVIGLAFVYLRYTHDIYGVNSIILIDDKSVGGISTELSAFQDLQLMGGTNTSIVNEIGILKSLTLFDRVVKDLDLNIRYYRKGSIKDAELYDSEIPFKIIFFKDEEVLDNSSFSFVINPISETKYHLLNLDDEIINEGVFGKNISTEIGEINITPINPEKVDFNENFIIELVPVRSLSNFFKNKLVIEEESFGSSLLILRLEDNKRKRALDIVNNLIIQYNNETVKGKTLLAENTNKFINDRLEKITIELSQVDLNVEEFKTSNRLIDPAQGASIILQSNSDIEKKIVDLNSQIQLVDYIIDYLVTNPDDLIPSNLGLTEFNGNTDAYNRLLMERNRIIKSSSSLNPTVINLNSQISTLKQSLDQSLRNFKRSLTFSLNEVRRQESSLNSKIYSAPRQEREIRDIKRQQQITESLYLYLLQKREENGISLVGISPNAKVIDKANGSMLPIAPIPKMIYGIAGVLSFIICFIIISLVSFLDNKIHDSVQLEKMLNIPLLGVITKSKVNLLSFVKDNSPTAEGFRLLRTNLDYMFSNVQNKSKTVFITSTIGGEGKSFVSINLAEVLAINNKKVLLIGADLRKPKLNEYLGINNSIGLSNYLVNKNICVSEILFSEKKLSFDIICSGETPPNPSELLINGRFEELLEEVKKEYDFILVDTPPVSLVSDTLFIGSFADTTLYVVRANYLDIRLLNIPKKLHKNDRLPNMALVLNDTRIKNANYGYGYGY